MDRHIRCIDAGSEYCPCFLSETGDCIVCSHLQGNEFCDCNWCGSCIFNEFYWNGLQMKKSRGSILSNIVNQEFINESLVLLTLQVPQGMARELIQPGSYIIVRNPEKPSYFDTPISVMDVNEGASQITIALQAIGAKTKSLLTSKKEVLLKGPYWNGIIGLENLKKLKDKKILMVVRGIAQAPAVPVIKYLNKNKNNIILALDPGNIQSVFIEKYIERWNLVPKVLDVRSEAGLAAIEDLLQNESFDLVFSSGSDLLHHDLLQMIKNQEKNIAFSSTNNREICCGEGVCGACSIYTKDGNILKGCKVQTMVEEILQRGTVND
ncbi:sulfide/dihydroorotate dehydrogenase-like FAD/NAD-binding protein [Geosporobacter ferrireducens]|uniref:FAD-binding FR-type domain-containing protein n=1 Tax=Geosporobacter ferrireducens TaxID=1424294 RepID=A0A1D8GB32_9FIRM|nr:sulfide/dihydroorotate dehydrogenase-like FAD/NAD-binding protein [Geosporobacter ferrireducens]AOT68121.1 hypothetical protein Gferi_00115 [Geosporobacter ferrireducens]